MSYLKLLKVTCLILLFTVTINENVFSQSFSAKTDFAAGSNPRSVATGDINGDGKPDLAVVNKNSNSVSVLINKTNNGASIPSFYAKTDFATATSPSSVAIEDLNGDGKPDLAVTNRLSNNVSVFFNTTPPGATTPSFSPKTDFATGIYPFSIAIKDLNGDGKPDLAVANNKLFTGSISVLFNTTTTGAATPSFSPKTDFVALFSSKSVAIGDINGDSKPDLVVANSSSNKFSVFLNTTATGAATPSFSAKTNFATLFSPKSVAIGDINGDGKQDIAVANNGANKVSVFINKTTAGATTPSFYARTDFITGSLPQFVAIGDFNGDAKPDMVVANNSSNSVSVFINTTAPEAITSSFSPKSDFATGVSPFSVAIGDINGDGKLDLAVANGGSNSVSVLLNSKTINNYTITSTTDANGTISPLGSVSVNSGNSQSYTITANVGYHIADVLVDGSSVGTVANYTFSNVTAEHTIDASFAINVFTITSISGSNGTITPFGVANVNYGQTENYTITQNTGYHIDDVLVDGVSVGTVSSYTFSNVTADHTIEAKFAIDTFNITSSTDANGTISPLGLSVVNYGQSQAYTITPNTGYIVADVLVDGSSVGALVSYTFSNVTADHTISVSFKISSMAMKQAAKDLLISYLTNSDKKIRKAAKKGVKHIAKSLEPKLWVDANHLNSKHGKKVFDEEKHAVKDLFHNEEHHDKHHDGHHEDNDKKNEFPEPFRSDVLTAINFLVTADNNLAQIAINEVVCNGDKKCGKELEKSNKEMSKAAHKLAEKEYDKAIDHYKKAWEHAQKATKKNDDDKDDDSIANNNISIDKTTNIPVDFSLNQNYPNPFNPSTVIKYALPEASFVSLKIYNMLGEEIKTLINSDKSAGTYSVQWNGDNNFGIKVASGTYIYRIIAGKNIVSKKMILLK